MKHLALLLAPAIGLGLTAAVAQTTLPEIPDTDGSGAWSLAELQVLLPDLTEDIFVVIDANGDGAVDQDELTAAVEAGTVTLPDE
ncbi:MAG: EF-hand domain-containing protein [Pseudotabrizicola sp.]|uniref:EF-hand domain-containing protein n=1 Tax=Pseudotabrizicola sp. TaxID=2939647 RepID=UPI0027200389|nr:EF-hand domain-containing protein [Pseudotabrizicola sp.]MDO8883088.1 EF-hand domain-containing protein [Pseudotabrizicola sp.]MDP2082077.1 EF-hand domain-containing protein [Pseudotabrizicola sp.]MDZ7576470.1 EF-hand domain-containing protein [Pseudotabrizicola sp.]